MFNMSTAVTVKTSAPDALSENGDAIKFDLISCLLTAEELDDKCEEQYEVIWNGLNKETVFD